MTCVLSNEVLKHVIIQSYNLYSKSTYIHTYQRLQKNVLFLKKNIKICFLSDFVFQKKKYMYSPL